MRRRKLVTAFVLSVLLHALLALVLLWGVAPGPRSRTAAVGQHRLEIQIVQLPPERPNASAPRPPQPAEEPTPSARQRRAERAHPSTERLAESPASLAETAPLRAPTPAHPPAASTPREGAPILPPGEGTASSRTSLLPRDSVRKEIEVPPREEPAGKTLYPDDPSLSARAKRAEEEIRVKDRVDGWADDAAAEARVQRGLPHPYLTEVGDAVRGGLNSVEGGTPAALGGPPALELLVNRYRNAAEQYARTGNPGDAIPPGLAPRQTEKQNELFGNERQSIWARAFTQSADTLQLLSHGAPLLALTLELRQRPSGQILSERVIERSGSAKFDAFVMRVVPLALSGLGAVPHEALHGRSELRSVWRIQGWARLPKKLERAMTLLGAPAVEGIPLDVLVPQLAAHEQFDFRARLLRAY